MPDLNITDQFALRMTDAAIDLDRYSASIRQKMLSHLKLLEIKLVEEINRSGIDEAAKVTTKQIRAENLLKKVQTTIRNGYAKLNGDFREEMVELAKIQHEAQITLMNSVITVDLFSVTLSKAELTALANQSIILGLPAKEWWSTQTDNLRRAFAAEIRMGVSAGETNQELIQRIRGRSTGRYQRIQLPSGKWKRVPQFSGGIMDRQTYQASALVRTSVQSVNNDILNETYKENKDLLNGVEALVTLDGKTTLICIARAGSAWDMSGEPIEESGADEPFPGPPPWHFNCRTVLMPVLKSWDDLASEAGGERLGLLEGMEPKARASMDGLISGKVRSFEDWYKIKGDAFARKQLGPGRFDLWKDKKITLNQLIDQSGRPLTIEQLKQRYVYN